jgi:hypothetical protein
MERYLQQKNCVNRQFMACEGVSYSFHIVNT